MIGKASRHGRGALYPAVAMTAHPQLLAQALMLGTEVVDAAHQVHQRLQGLRIAQQGSAAAHQDSKARTEGGVEPLDESGIEPGSAVALDQQRLSNLQATLRHTPGHADHALALITLDHLTDVNIRSGDQPGSPAFTTSGQRTAKNLLDGLHIGNETSHTDQQRAGQGTGTNDLHQIQGQLLISPLGNHTAQP